MTPKNIKTQIEKIVMDIVREKGRTISSVSETISLYEDGVGLDSMDTASLSTTLEQEFGSEPYMSGEFPRTIADIVKFYNPK